MNVTFSIPNKVVKELDDYAKANGFDGAKQMVIAYVKATVLSARKAAIPIPPEPSVDDVIIS